MIFQLVIAIAQIKCIFLFFQIKNPSVCVLVYVLTFEGVIDHKPTFT